MPDPIPCQAAQIIAGFHPLGERKVPQTQT